MNEHLYQILKDQCKKCGHTHQKHKWVSGYDYIDPKVVSREDTKELAFMWAGNAIEVVGRCGERGCECYYYEPYTPIELCEIIENQWDYLEKNKKHMNR